MKSRYSVPACSLLGGIVGLAAFSATPARAETKANKYVEPGSNQVLEYNLYIPDNLVAGTKYPLVVYLHAASNTNPPRRTLSKDGTGWTPTLRGTATAPAFYMNPISQTNSSGWGDPLAAITSPQKFEGRLTVVVLKELLTKYPIDPDRLYVTGASMGARGTYDLLRRYPDLFAAGAPAAAPASAADAAIYATQNIWSVMGEKDNNIVNENRETIAATRKACGNPIYTELAGHGHDSWRTIYPLPEFMAWMLAQRRGVPWTELSKAPTEAQIGERLTPSQQVVVTPTCKPGMVGAGGSGAGGSGGAGGAGGTTSGGSAGAGPISTAGQGGLAGSDNSSAGAGGQPSSAGAAAVAGSSGLANSGGSAGAASTAGASAIGGAPGSAGSTDTELDPGEDPANGCSVAVAGTGSVRGSLAQAVPLLAALGMLGLRRRRARRAS